MAVATTTFIRARNSTKGRSVPIDVLVIHTMEAPEKPDTAENVARWFAGSTAPQASAHYCIDNNSKKHLGGGGGGHEVHTRAADDDFGAATLKAVKKAQATYGLNPDGIAGPLTWHTLETSH